MTPPTRTARAAAAVAAVALLLAGTACRPARRDAPPRVVVETQYLDALSKAITAVNKARKTLADDANAIAAGAAAIDDVDAAAVTGDRTKVRAARAKAAAATAKATTAARRVSKDVTAYDKAIKALDAAAGEGLDAPQRAAVDDVVATATDEAKQLRFYSTSIATLWPRYQALDENQKLWLARSSNGWYRDEREAAGAYLVLVDRPALERTRRSLAIADDRRLDAAKETHAAVERARVALASLLD